MNLLIPEILDEEYEILRDPENKDKIFIVKPSMESQGKGIFIVKGTAALKKKILQAKPVERVKVESEIDMMT